MNNISMNSKNIYKGLNGSNLMNNNSMNNYSKENKSGLKTATLDNIIMDNHTRTYILDEPVPHIGVETLRPTPFRRIIRNLRDTTRKAAYTAKRKWNEYYDWLSTYAPQPIRDGSSVRKLNNHVRELYQQSPDFTPEWLALMFHHLYEFLQTL